jgi:hypothetical protein
LLYYPHKVKDLQERERNQTINTSQKRNIFP